MGLRTKQDTFADPVSACRSRSAGRINDGRRARDRPETPVNWIVEQSEKYNLLLGGIDHYRYTLLSKAFASAGFSTDKRTGNVKLTYTPELIPGCAHHYKRVYKPTHCLG